MDIVVLGLILQSTVMVQGPRSRTVHDVVLKQVLAGGDIAVEIVGTAVEGPAVGDQVIVEPDVGIAVLLQPCLIFIVTTVVGGPCLDTAKVTGDACSKVMDAVELNIDNIVSGSLQRSFRLYYNIHIIFLTPCLFIPETLPQAESFDHDAIPHCSGYFIVGNSNIYSSLGKYCTGAPVPGDATSIKIVVGDLNVLVTFRIQL